MSAGQLDVTVGAPDWFKNNTKGLMGVFDDDPNDDLLPPGENAVPLSNSSSEKTIFNEFGELCTCFLPLCMLAKRMHFSTDLINNIFDLKHIYLKLVLFDAVIVNVLLTSVHFFYLAVSIFFEYFATRFMCN